MTPQAFIESRLGLLRESPLPVSNENLEERIFSALMSKKFRKYSCSQGQQEGIRRAIRLNIDAGEPIRLVFPFGGYKLWRFAEAPEADWAELFTLMYYARWLQPIAEMYEPGVVFEFSSDEIIVERLNNIPKADTARYADTFRVLCNVIATYAPSNLRFSLVPVASRYSPEEFEADFSERARELMERDGGVYRDLSPEEAAMIELNVRLAPGQADDPQWRQKVDLIHRAYGAVSKRRPFFNTPEKITVFPTNFPQYNCIAVGTTKTSIAKFWAGVGTLKRTDNAYIETILSPSQLERASFEWSPVSIKGLTGKNFDRVRVIG